MKTFKIFDLMELSDYEVEHETTGYCQQLTTLVNAFKTAKQEKVLVNVPCGDSYYTFTLEQVDDTDYKLDCIDDSQEEHEPYYANKMWMYHWIFTFMNGTYGLSDEDFTKFE